MYISIYKHIYMYIHTLLLLNIFGLTTLLDEVIYNMSYYSF